MRATIPETMLLSDLLKPTGYDCPQDLQGKTFDQTTSGGGDVVLENNKEVSITANGTTTITPSSGKDAMKKVTATVNVPSAVLEDDKPVSITTNGTIEITPSAGKDAMKKVTATVNVSGGSGVMPLRFFDGRHSGYSANPRGFWVISAAQVTGKACCLVTAPSSESAIGQSYCIQPIQSLTGNRLSVDEYGRESFVEVTAEVVTAAIAAL